MTVAQVLGARPGAWRGSGAALHRLAVVVAIRAAEIDRLIERLAVGWAGETAAAALGALCGLRDRLDGYAALLLAAEPVLDAHAGHVTRARAALAAAALPVPPDQLPRSIAASLAGALRLAGDSDAAAARRLSALESELRSARSGGRR